MVTTGIVASTSPRAGAARVAAFVRLMRLDRAIVAAGYALLGAYLADATAASVSTVVRAALVVLLSVCFGFVVNDFRDARIDAAAKPYRPLPAGLVTPREAIATALLLLFCALAVATTLGWLLALVAACSLLLSAAYSFGLKSTLLIGNITMGVLVGATIPYGALAAGNLSTPAVAAAALVLLFATSQEVLFNVRDEEGDRLGGARTTANRMGPRMALRLYRTLLVVTAVLAVSVGFRGEVSVLYLTAAATCIVIPVAALLVLLTGRIDEIKLRRAVAITRVTWISGIVPMALIGT